MLETRLKQKKRSGCQAFETKKAQQKLNKNEVFVSSLKQKM